MEKHCCFCISFNLISCVLCVLFLLHWTLRARMFLQSVPFLDIFFTYIYIYTIYTCVYLCTFATANYSPHDHGVESTYDHIPRCSLDKLTHVTPSLVRVSNLYHFIQFFFLYKLFLTPADSSLTKLIELRFVFTKRHSVGYVCRIFCQPIFKPKMSSVVNIRRCHTLHATVNSGALPACTFTGEPHWLPLKSYHHPPLWWPILPPHTWPWKLLITSPFLFSHPINMTYKK